MKKAKLVAVISIVLLLCAFVGMVFIGRCGMKVMLVTICFIAGSMLCDLYLIMYHINKYKENK